MANKIVNLTNAEQVIFKDVEKNLLSGKRLLMSLQDMVDLSVSYYRYYIYNDQFDNIEPYGDNYVIKGMLMSMQRKGKILILTKRIGGRFFSEVTLKNPLGNSQ